MIAHDESLSPGGGSDDYWRSHYRMFERENERLAKRIAELEANEEGYKLAIDVLNRKSHERRELLEKWREYMQWIEDTCENDDPRPEHLESLEEDTLRAITGATGSVEEG